MAEQWICGTTTFAKHPHRSKCRREIRSTHAPAVKTEASNKIQDVTGNSTASTRSDVKNVHIGSSGAYCTPSEGETTSNKTNDSNDYAKCENKKRIKKVPWANDDRLTEAHFIDTRIQHLKTLVPKNMITLPLSPNTLQAIKSMIKGKNDQDNIESFEFLGPTSSCSTTDNLSASQSVSGGAGDSGALGQSAASCFMQVGGGLGSRNVSLDCAASRNST